MRAGAAARPERSRGEPRRSAPSGWAQRRAGRRPAGRALPFGSRTPGVAPCRSPPTEQVPRRGRRVRRADPHPGARPGRRSWCSRASSPRSRCRASSTISSRGAGSAPTCCSRSSARRSSARSRRSASRPRTTSRSSRRSSPSQAKARRRRRRPKSGTKGTKKAREEEVGHGQEVDQARHGPRRSRRSREEDGEAASAGVASLGPLRRRLDVELVRRGLVTSRARAVEVGRRRARDGRRRARRVGGAPGRGGRADRGRRPDRPGSCRAAARSSTPRSTACAVDVRGRRVLDAGASTGGFTDCLLQRGADPSSRSTSGAASSTGRCARIPGRRARADEPASPRARCRGGPAELAVADLSFISLRTVAPALVRLTAPTATFVLLVKPQFEAGRRRIGSGGIVRDPAVHREVLAEVVDGLGEQGIVVTDVSVAADRRRRQRRVPRPGRPQRCHGGRSPCSTR